MATADFLRVLDIIFNDENLQSELRAIKNTDEFAAAIIEIAVRNGLAFDPQEIFDLININRRSWVERHIA